MSSADRLLWWVALFSSASSGMAHYRLLQLGESMSATWLALQLATVFVLGVGMAVSGGRRK